MKYRIKQLLLLSTIFCSTQTLASEVIAKIEYLLPHPGNVVFMNMVGNNKDSINGQGTNGNCITSTTGNFRIDLSNETGVAIYAALLTAQAQDKDIQIVGNNTCTSGRENVSWVLLR